MLRLLALTLGIWGSSAFAFQSTRIQCTGQNALMELVPMNGYFNTAGGRTKAETPFHFWLAPDTKSAENIEHNRESGDASPVLQMVHAKFYWQIDEQILELELERTLRGEAFSETNNQGVMLVGTANKSFLAGFQGWILSCSVIE